MKIEQIADLLELTIEEITYFLIESENKKEENHV